MDAQCRLCSRLKGAAAPGWADRILFETDTFVVTPSLGAIVEGWVLISTKSHRLCFGSLSKAAFEELRFLKSAITSLLERSYGRIICFEHGPSRPAQPVGCTVDHAHLHLVPSKCCVRDSVAQIFPAGEWERISSHEHVGSYHRAGLPYIFLEEDGETFASTNLAVESQLFRKVIARFKGVPSHYDWREYPFLENVQATVEAFEKCAARGASPIVRRAVPCG